MTGPGRRFDPSELLSGTDADPGEGELADAFAAARMLEAHSVADRVQPTDGFEDRVMAAIAIEPAPRVVIRPHAAARGGWPGALLLALRDAWAITTSGGRPLAIRAQAVAILMVAGVVLTSFAGVAAVGVGGLLSSQPSPSPFAQPTQAPSPSAPSASPTIEASPTPTDPGPAAQPTETLETPVGTETPEATETSEATETPETTETSETTEEPEATESDEAGETLEPAETLRPGETLKPGETLRPAETPRP